MDCVTEEDRESDRAPSEVEISPELKESSVLKLLRLLRPSVEKADGNEGLPPDVEKADGNEELPPDVEKADGNEELPPSNTDDVSSSLTTRAMGCCCSQADDEPMKPTTTTASSTATVRLTKRVQKSLVSSPNGFFLASSSDVEYE